MKKINSFGSSSALHCQNLELLRGSLPNINKGYYSLRAKKPNRSSDQRMPCPLPIYPSYLKAQVNGSMTEISANYKPASSSYDQQGSRTLPSSYRIHSRNNSSKRDLTSLTPSPRRESSPFFPSHQNGSAFNMGRRESAPGSSRRFLSPASSPTAYQRSIGSTTSLQSPTKSSNNSSRNVGSSNLEHHRSVSHSSSRRQPLTTVHNRSPQRGTSPASYQNGEFHTAKIPSKIPSPALKSGIPVPSGASKATTEDNWSHDCF
ncbi:uncharacterized protein LOC129232946 [Uloborus diversus]|uniref:uncharacterized protein LOC129232946 n=1 Tax=Uloborus diversus TaxID=327109 RepID=UPI002409ACE0|nr:uncharacterized protein LOC129232946 [Uloborus diversus]